MQFYNLLFISVYISLTTYAMINIFTNNEFKTITETITVNIELLLKKYRFIDNFSTSVYVAKHYLSSKKFAAINLKFRAVIRTHNNQILLRPHRCSSYHANYLISRKFYSRDAERKSQRPYMTSPSNIDLSATSSMLILHSNSRSSCGARTRFAAVRINPPQKQSVSYYRAYPKNCRVTCMIPKKPYVIAFSMQNEKFDS